MDKLCDTVQIKKQLQLLYVTGTTYNLVLLHALKGAKANYNKNLTEH